jgi:hypothetical protein
MEEILSGEGDPRTTSSRIFAKVNADVATAFTLASLIEDGYVTGASAHWGLGNTRPTFVAGVLRLTPKGRRVAGDWPSEAGGAALIKAVEALLAQTDDPERRGRLETFLRSARSVGQELLTDVAAKFLAHVSGIA